MKKLCAILLTLVLIVSIPIAAQAKATKKAGTVAVSYGTLNVRAKATTDSEVIASLSKGATITLITQQGSWWQVEYAKGKFGYCHADYITPIGGTTVTVTLSSGTLNVRSGGGTQYTRIGSLINGESVVELSKTNGWSKILYHGTKIGYVSSRYLASGVSLSVPNYKQTDSRWANIKVGSSGKTIAQIGCVTTGISMIESYRTGKTLTPDIMVKQLSYTSSGNVYWPSHFVTYTSYDLSKILSILQQGKPVLLGAKNAYGTQHWVVITGFSGTSLTPANFTINDPATNSRTNLQQFFNAYPTFYKYFSY